MVQCSQCGSYRIESRITLISPKNNKAQFRLTDLSLPFVLVFITAILYAAIDTLLSKDGVGTTFGIVFLLLFLITVIMLLIAYIRRGHFVEKLRYRCTECKHHWDIYVPPARSHARREGGPTP